MITRSWRGWTSHENADQYERLLQTVVFPAILQKNIAGLRRIELCRRISGDEIEFMTLFRFDDMDSVKLLAGEDHEAAYIPVSARKMLSRFAQTAEHFETIESIAA